MFNPAVNSLPLVLSPVIKLLCAVVNDAVISLPLVLSPPIKLVCAVVNAAVIPELCVANAVANAVFWSARDLFKLAVVAVREF